jgi:hypothetical protein
MSEGAGAHRGIELESLHFFGWDLLPGNREIIKKRESLEMREVEGVQRAGTYFLVTAK